MDDSESNSSLLNSNIPLYRSLSVSKNTQTEDMGLYVLPHQNVCGCGPGPESNMYYCQMPPDVWRPNNCMPVFPNYVTASPFTFCHLHSAGSMCHFSAPWYPFYCSGYLPMNIIPSPLSPLHMPSPSVHMRVIMPPCSDVQSRVGTNETLSGTTSETNSVTTPDKDVVSRTSEHREAKQPFKYYKIVDEKQIGKNQKINILKKLEQNYLQPRNFDDVQYKRSSETMLHPEAQSYELLPTRSSWDNGTSLSFNLKTDTTKKIQRKPRSRFSTGVETSTPDIISSTDTQNAFFNEKYGVANHSEDDEIKNHPVIKRYINKNLMNKVSDVDYNRDLARSQHNQSETEMKKKTDLDEDKLEVTRNVNRLANLLCDFNASCGDPSNQYYTTVVRKSIEKALCDGIERNDAFVDDCNKVNHVPERESSGNANTMPTQQIYSYRDISDKEMKQIRNREYVSRDNSFKPDNLPAILNHRKIKLTFKNSNGFQDEEIFCIQNSSSSNTSINCDKKEVEYCKIDEARSLRFSEIINPKKPELKIKCINTTETHCNCGLKPYQSTNNKLDATSSSSLSSTNYSCETINSQNSSYRPSSNERVTRSCDSSNYGKYLVNDDKNASVTAWPDNLSDSGHSVTSRKSDYNDNQAKAIYKKQQFVQIGNSDLRYSSFEMPGGNCDSKSNSIDNENSLILMKKSVCDNNNNDASFSNRLSTNLQYRSLSDNDPNGGNNHNNFVGDFSHIYNMNFYCDVATNDSNDENNFSTPPPSEYYTEANGQVVNANESVIRDRQSSNSMSNINENQYMHFQQQNLQQYQEYIQQQQTYTDLDNLLARKQKRYNHLSILNNIETLSVISEADEENSYDLNTSCTT